MDGQLNSDCPCLDHRDVTFFFFDVLGPAAAPFGAGHAPWKPYPRVASTWVTHIAPRLGGPGAAYHSHPGLAGLGACAFAAATPTTMTKMPKPAIKARFMISSLWINNCGARERPREANVPAMPGKKTIQNE